MSEDKKRECGMLTTAGAQGVGKTYQNMHIIKDYVKDKFDNGVKGRKVLILDTNGEYTDDQFAKNDIPGFKVKTLKVKDVKAWCSTDNTECRRIDMKSIKPKEKKAIVEHVCTVYRLGMLVLEDINTYIISLTHMEDIVGALVNLRHKGVDVLISFQSLRPVEPRIWQNSRWVRMHYQADNVNDIKGKLTDPTLFKISQYLINARYFNGDKRFFVYILNLDKKVEGDFTVEEFNDACEQYLRSNKKYIKEYREAKKLKTDEEAIEGQTKLYKEQYYGN